MAQKVFLTHLVTERRFGSRNVALHRMLGLLQGQNSSRLYQPCHESSGLHTPRQPSNGILEQLPFGSSTDRWIIPLEMPHPCLPCPCKDSHYYYTTWRLPLLIILGIALSCLFRSPSGHPVPPFAGAVVSAYFPAIIRCTTPDIELRGIEKPGSISRHERG